MNKKLLLLILCVCPTVLLAKAKAPAKPITPTVVADQPATSKAVHDAWEKAQFRFTPEVEDAFLDAAKTSALKKLAEAGKTLPADFLALIESDRAVKATVYGARQDASGILLNLRSLELDLGQDVVRSKYTQLALATAVVFAKEGDKADLTPRPLLALHIDGDPRKPVDTHAKNRALDVDDHIINFLVDHAPIMEEVVVGYKEVLPELKYDAKGVAIPQRGAKPKKEAVREMRPRPLRAADVIASADLEKEFNEYMTAHGQSAQIHCGGEKRLNWNSHDLGGVDQNGAKQAYELIKHAYEAKGFLPAQRDPTPTLAERCAFLIRNNEQVIPADKKIAWPKFPLTAPWPMMTMLAADSQPLREREDIWQRYSDHGEFHGYGEYIGNIAQYPTYLQARRLAPYAFQYGSVQMMLKDGGVCGTMANIAVRSFSSLGVPASTAGQPGHCAFVKYGYNADKKSYACQGGQYVTAGDAGTNVHVPWYFGDIDHPRPMVYHQSVAWATNFGFQSYLDSTVAHTFFEELGDSERKAHGNQLLESALALNPYNFLLVDDVIANTNEPIELASFWKTLKPALASGKEGCPADGLYNATIKDKISARLTALPVPADPAIAKSILTFLQDEKFGSEVVLTSYEVAVDGLPAVLAQTESAFKAHLASTRTDATCAAMAKLLAATAGRIADKKQSAQWCGARLSEIQGKEMYFGHQGQITTDASVGILAKLAGQKPRASGEQLQSLLDQITERLKNEVAGTRTPASCKQLAGTISTAARQITDTDQKKLWAATLSKTISGQEQFHFQAKNKPQTQRDPCADVIGQLLGPKS